MNSDPANPIPGNLIVPPAEALVVGRIINSSGVLAALSGVTLPLALGIAGGWGFGRSVVYTALALIYVALLLSYLLSHHLANWIYRRIGLYLVLCGVVSFGLTLISADPYLQPLVFSVPFVIAAIAVAPRLSALCGGSYLLAAGSALLLSAVPVTIVALSMAVYTPIFLFMFGMVRLAVDQATAHRNAARLAAENARLAAENAEHATLAERNRIARELHDTIAQGLTALTMQIEAAQRALQRDPERAATRLNRAHELARATLVDVRKSVWALAEQPLDAAALAANLRRQAHDLQARSGLRVDVQVSGQAYHLAPEQTAQIVRIVQEALTNVERHAQAHEIVITLEYQPEQVLLQVRDNGVGFDPHQLLPRSDGGGFGLNSLHERAKLSGGILRIESALGAGTTIRVLWQNRSSKS